jgi:hypothetical protein
VLVDESVSLLDEVEDARDRAALAGEAGWLSRELGDYARAVTMLEVALPLFQRLGDTQGVADTLLSLGEVAREQGDPETTARFCGESLRLHRELGDTSGIGWSLYDLGLAAWMTGALEQATRLYDEVMVVMRDSYYAVGVLDVLTARALVLHDRGDLAEAESTLADTLGCCEGTNGYLYPAPMALEAMAGVATGQGEFDRATTLFGAVASPRARIGFATWPVLRGRNEANLAVAKEVLGPM